MRAVLDSSTLISLGRAGLLYLLARVGLDPVIIDVVHQEAVEGGIRAGHLDAQAIRSAIASFEIVSTGREGSADEAVLRAARQAGWLVTNDAALGRRARAAGARWVRTADLVVIAVRSGAVSATEGRSAIASLLAAGRITPELAHAYRDLV